MSGRTPADSHCIADCELLSVLTRPRAVRQCGRLSNALPLILRPPRRVVQHQNPQLTHLALQGILSDGNLSPQASERTEASTRRVPAWREPAEGTVMIVLVTQ
jgi:hypothetical protein